MNYRALPDFRDKITGRRTITTPMMPLLSMPPPCRGHGLLQDMMARLCAAAISLILARDEPR